MCSWRYPEGRTSSCRYVWPQRLFGKSRRNPHQHFITTQIVKIRRCKLPLRSMFFGSWSWRNARERTRPFTCNNHPWIASRSRHCNTDNNLSTSYIIQQGTASLTITPSTTAAKLRLSCLHLQARLQWPRYTPFPFRPPPLVEYYMYYPADYHF